MRADGLNGDDVTNVVEDDDSSAIALGSGFIEGAGGRCGADDRL